VRGANPDQDTPCKTPAPELDDAERKLWRHLRARTLGGFKFVRQEPIGPYLVDFVCREQRLIVEVDGGQHADRSRDARTRRFSHSPWLSCASILEQ
jgi:very-short-patch-repair endonuclease